MRAQNQRCPRGPQSIGSRGHLVRECVRASKISGANAQAAGAPSVLNVNRFQFRFKKLEAGSGLSCSVFTAGSAGSVPKAVRFPVPSSVPKLPSFLS